MGGREPFEHAILPSNWTKNRAQDTSIERRAKQAMANKHTQSHTDLLYITLWTAMLLSHCAPHYRLSRVSTRAQSILYYLLLIHASRVKCRPASAPATLNMFFSFFFFL